MDLSDRKKIVLPSIEGRDLATALAQTAAKIPQYFNLKSPRTILLCCTGEAGGSKIRSVAGTLNSAQSCGVIPGDEALLLATIAVRQVGTHAESGPIRQLLCELAEELSDLTTPESD
jgi:hypothetical protein